MGPSWSSAWDCCWSPCRPLQNTVYDIWTTQQRFLWFFVFVIMPEQNRKFNNAVLYLNSEWGGSLSNNEVCGPVRIKFLDMITLVSRKTISLWLHKHSGDLKRRGLHMTRITTGIIQSVQILIFSVTCEKMHSKILVKLANHVKMLYSNTNTISQMFDTFNN